MLKRSFRIPYSLTMNNCTVLAFYSRSQKYRHCKHYCLGYFRSLFRFLVQ